MWNRKYEDPEEGKGSLTWEAPHLQDAGPMLPPAPSKALRGPLAPRHRLTIRGRASRQLAPRDPLSRAAPLRGTLGKVIQSRTAPAQPPFPPQSLSPDLASASGPAPPHPAPACGPAPPRPVAPPRPGLGGAAHPSFSSARARRRLLLLLALKHAVIAPSAFVPGRVWPACKCPKRGHADPRHLHAVASGTCSVREREDVCGKDLGSNASVTS